MPEFGKVENNFSQRCYEKKVIRKEKNGRVVPVDKTVLASTLIPAILKKHKQCHCRHAACIKKLAGEKCAIQLF